MGICTIVEVMLSSEEIVCLYSKRATLMGRSFSRRLGYRIPAEDLSQIALFSAIRSAPRHDASRNASLHTWILLNMNFAIREAIRGELSFRYGDSPVFVSCTSLKKTTSPWRAIENAIDCSMLCEKLTPMKRLIVTHHSQGFSITEIAIELNCEPRKILRLYSEALTTLRNLAFH